MKALTKNHFILAAEQFGTPLFLYHADVIKHAYNQLRRLLASSCDIFYSMKANPALAICQYLNKLGSNCEVSSKNELLTALQAGFLPQQIIFVGPGKNDEEITLCIQKKIKSIVCESVEEICRVNVLSKKYHKKTSILIRINPDFQVTKAPIKMSGVATQFGIDTQILIKNMNYILAFKFISIDGIQIFNASRVLDSDALYENAKNILQLADQLSRQFSIEWKTIDIGGGFGIPYFANEEALCISTLISKISVLFQMYNISHPATRFIVELGRYLVSESGYLITSVQSVKESHGKHFAIVDGGMHCYFSATGLSSFVHRNFPMQFILQAPDINYKQINYNVTGPLCTPGDVLLKDVVLPPLKKGDKIILSNVGAYGLSASPGRFLSHGSPSEILYVHNKLHCIRRKETLNDILSTQLEIN